MAPPVNETQVQLGSVFTPGDLSNSAWQNGSTMFPQSKSLGQTTSIAHSVPIWGVVAIALLLGFLELRRKRLGGR